MKVIMLDMDGVVNSYLEQKAWLTAKWEELKTLFPDREERHQEVKKAFGKEFCNMTEFVFPKHAALITKICEETDAKIVWSSTWRNIEEYKDKMEFAKDMFNRRDLPGDRLIDVTPDLGADHTLSIPRGHEIEMWMQDHPEVTKCAILDDRRDAGNTSTVKDRTQFFMTEDLYGITPEIAKDVIDYLNGE